MSPTNSNDLVQRVTRELATLRKDKNVTIQELAERLDTTVQNVQRIERGQNITLLTLSRIATALGYQAIVSFEPDPAGARTPPQGRKRTPSAETPAVLEAAETTGRGKEGR